MTFSKLRNLILSLAYEFTGSNGVLSQNNSACDRQRCLQALLPRLHDGRILIFILANANPPCEIFESHSCLIAQSKVVDSSPQEIELVLLA